MERITVNLAERSYSISIGAGLFEESGVPFSSSLKQKYQSKSRCDQ